MAESASGTANMPDYLLEPNAVLLDQCRWRHGQVKLFLSLSSHPVSALLDSPVLYLAPSDTPVDAFQYPNDVQWCTGARLLQGEFKLRERSANSSVRVCFLLCSSVA